MINEIKINVKDRTNESEISNYLKKIIRKQAFDKTWKIYGVWHAVFTISDPRCILLKQYAQQLAKRQGREEEFHLYCLIEELSPYLIQEEHPSVSHICANVDFYSWFIYNMLNIPKELFTPLFAIARVAWRSAHRIEEVLFGTKIYYQI